MCTCRFDGSTPVFGPARESRQGVAGPNNSSASKLRQRRWSRRRAPLPSGISHHRWHRIRGSGVGARQRGVSTPPFGSKFWLGTSRRWWSSWVLRVASKSWFRRFRLVPRAAIVKVNSRSFRAGVRRQSIVAGVLSLAAKCVVGVDGPMLQSFWRRFLGDGDSLLRCVTRI